MTHSMTGPLAEAALRGLVAGYAVSIPVGALAVLLVSLTARTSFRVGAAGALGVATADGTYATVAVLGGAAVAGAVEPVAVPLRWTAAGVLVLMAARSGSTALRSLRAARVPSDTLKTGPGLDRAPRCDGVLGGERTSGGDRVLGRASVSARASVSGSHRASGSCRASGGEPVPPSGGAALGTPVRAYLGLLGLTLLNPWAIIYFSALTLGQRNLGGTGQLTRAVFIAAIIFASLSWQLVLASGGVALGRTLTGVRGRAVTGLVSSVVIVGLAVGLVLWG